MESDNVYRGSIEPVLVSPSNLYSDKEISVSVSGPSSCPIYTVLLTTTNYCPNQIVCDFDLRRLFYSRQCFKSICHFSACTDHKWVQQYKASTAKLTITST